MLHVLATTLAIVSPRLGLGVARPIYATVRTREPRLSNQEERGSDASLLSLQVSSPALLLNHMAERYASTSRILMEFVDNSLDDAEALFDHEARSYHREVHVDVFVSREERTLRIRDNCRGSAIAAHELSLCMDSHVHAGASDVTLALCRRRNSSRRQWMGR